MEGADDLEIKKEYLNGALNGDEVEVEDGKVKRVITRTKESFVGTVKGNTVEPDDVRFYAPIVVGKTNYDTGDKVLVRLQKYEKGEFYGTVIEHIGRAGEHRVEMNSIVLEHGFRTRFPDEALTEAHALELNHAHMIKEEARVRADFRGVPTFTIDPDNAKDFDDAISVKTLPDGNLEIGVHIADVTHFVREGSALEAEVQKRGTSVYLVDSTIPMLPEALSSNICSLREGEDRLVFSAVFYISPAGVVLERKFQKSIIHSQKRFTYEAAQEILDTGKGKFVEELGILRQLARVMREKREQEGAIDFGDNEFKFVLNEKGEPVSVVRKERLETMRMIEEFMLLANREVAAHIATLAQKVPEKNLVFLYRIHDEPKTDRIEELATFVRAIGYDFAHKKKVPSAKDIQKLLKDIAGKPEEDLIRTATLRSMAKAIYSPKNIGHFGLAFRYYTHFTSPIRRYPDMLVHRILESHLNGNPITRREYVDLEKRCLTASEQEAKATDAERESVRYKQVEYLAKKVGQTFNAVISGVTDWGLYVEDTESGAEGLVRVRSLGGDFYNYSQKEYSLVGQKTKKKFTLGQKVKAKLISADLAARTLDFELA